MGPFTCARDARGSALSSGRRRELHSTLLCHLKPTGALNMKDNKCYPCNGLGYHIETCIEYDGTLDRVKVSCACCDGTGEAK